MTTWWPRASARKRKSGKARSWFGSFGRIQFAAPGQAVDVDTQRVLAQALLRARGLQDDRHHGVPAFGARGRAIDEPLFCPADVERGIAGARDAGDLHRHRLAADAGERIVLARVVVEHRRSEEHTSELQSLMRRSYAVFC